MLTCRKCGAQMSGVDIICKKCGTPWGKKGKNKFGLFFTVLFIFAISAGILYYTNPNLIMGLFSYNVPEENIPQDTINPPIPEQNIDIPEPEPQPEEPKTEPILPPVFTTASASSSLASQGTFYYIPDMTLDNKNTTAWLEGSPNNGIGEWIQYSNETEQYVSKIQIFNGYQKNNITYINNGRLKKIKLEFSDGTVTEKELPAQTYEESLNGTEIIFDNPIKTSFVKITILDVYKGVYYTDTAINEVKFF